MKNIQKRTKIIATVGPASNTKEKLLELAITGVNVFRLNFSHGDHESHLKVINKIKEINEEFNYNLAILLDLQGPKIRIGKVENDAVPVNSGDKLIITTEEILGTSKKVSTSYTSFPSDVKQGETVLVDDGRIQLEVVGIKGNEVEVKVIAGGMLKSRKGMNLPDTRISAPCLTQKDLEDLAFGLKHEVDWVAISFVREVADIHSLKNVIADKGLRTRVIAKIERPEAIKHISEIIEETDAIMIARGDLGIETDLAEVPLIQKEIMRKCHRLATPVIVATQMMESMVKNPLPTRAEINDVATAVIDGADALMLSEETAAGAYPLLSVKYMAQAIRSIETSNQMSYNKNYPAISTNPNFNTQQIIQSAVTLSDTTSSKAIIGTTETGLTAMLLARHRAKTKVFIFTKNKAILNTLNLLWGIKTFYSSKTKTLKESFHEMEKQLVKEGYLAPGDRYVKVGAIPPIDGQKTNMIFLGTISPLDEDLLK